MIEHPEFDKSLKNSIGLWTVDSCYKKVGFVAQEIVPHERDNIIEMAITKEEYLLLTKL